MLPLGMFLLGLGYLLPGHYPPWISFQQQWAAALGTGLIVLQAAVRAESKFTRWPPLAWVVLATALVPLVQLMSGQVAFASDGVIVSLYLVAFAHSVVAGASLRTSQRSEVLDGLCSALIAASVISTGIALFQWLRLGGSLYVADLPPNARPFANLAQPNHLATLLSMGIAALLRWYVVRRIAGFVASMGIAWLSFGLLLTQSRTAWLFVGWGLVAWLMYRQKARLQIPAVAVVASAVTFVIGVLLWGAFSDAAHVSSQTLESRLSAGPRRLIWPVLIDAAWRAPWLGYGWNQVGLAQQAAALAHPGSNYWFTDSHNLFLDLILWNGLPLGLLLSGLLLLWLFRQGRACSDPERWALLLMVSAPMLHAMLEYPHDYAYFLLPVGLLMGVLDGSGDQGGGVPLPRAALALPSVLMLAMLVWLGVEYVRVEETGRQVRFVSARIGVDRISAVALPEVLLLDGPREAQRFMLTEPRPGLSATELARMRSVAQRYASGPFLFRYAVAAGLNRLPTQARDTLGVLCKLNPAAKCEQARQEWVQLQLLHEDLREIAFPATAAGPASTR